MTLSRSRALSFQALLLALALALLAGVWVLDQSRADWVAGPLTLLLSLLSLPVHLGALAAASSRSRPHVRRSGIAAGAATLAAQVALFAVYVLSRSA